jgi:hypothetical protein
MPVCRSNLLRCGLEGVHEGRAQAKAAACVLPVLADYGRPRENELESRFLVDFERKQPFELLDGRRRQVVCVVDQDDDAPALRVALLEKDREQVALLDLGELPRTKIGAE